MRVVFLTHYYAPERGAPQTRLRETTAGLRSLGIESSVVTAHRTIPLDRSSTDGASSGPAATGSTGSRCGACR